MHSARTGELKVEGRAMIVHRRTSYIDGLKQVRKRARLSGKACYVWVRLLVPPSGPERKSVEAHVQSENSRWNLRTVQVRMAKLGLRNWLTTWPQYLLHRIVAEKQATPRTPMEQRIQAYVYVRVSWSSLPLGHGPQYPLERRRGWQFWSQGFLRSEQLSIGSVRTLLQTSYIVRWDQCGRSSICHF